MKKTAPILAVAALALASCSGMQPMGRGASNCLQGSCTFTVTVSGCSASQITVSQDPIWVDPAYRGPMHWELNAPTGWKFARPGIDIQGNSGEFDNLSHGAQKVTWNNNHRTVQPYKYNIVVEPPGGGTCHKDPTVMN